MFTWMLAADHVSQQLNNGLFNAAGEGQMKTLSSYYKPDQHTNNLSAQVLV